MPQDKILVVANASFCFTSKMKTQKNLEFLFLVLKSFILNKIACGTDDFPLSRNLRAASLSQSIGEMKLDSDTQKLSKLFALVTEILSIQCCIQHYNNNNNKNP